MGMNLCASGKCYSIKIPVGPRSLEWVLSEGVNEEEV